MAESTNMIEYSLTCTTVLMCHPTTINQAVHEIAVRIGWQQDGVFALIYTLTGDCSRLWIPSMRLPAEVDGLWQHTCFEAFVSAKGDSAYWEFNFSPSSEWAVYQFRGYRDRTSLAEEAHVPQILVRRTADRLELDIRTRLPHLLATQPLRLALSAVIEDDSGKLSYWALKHPPGKPDFHHPDSFALEIVPPKRETTEKEN